MLSELTPLELFRSLVVKAIHDQGIETTEMAEFYLCSLLADHVHSEKLSSDEPFATKFLRALDAEREAKGILFKELGDSSLFLSGFFQESLNTRLVNIDYYINMGANSYGQLADYLDGISSSQDLSPLYTELSEKFTEFVNVLTEVSERSRMGTSKDILKLYERWLRTRSRHTETLLMELGINPLEVPTGSIQ